MSHTIDSPDEAWAISQEPATGANIDASAIYRRLDQRRRKPAWMVPAAAALVIVAGGGALAFT